MIFGGRAASVTCRSRPSFSTVGRERLLDGRHGQPVGAEEGDAQEEAVGRPVPVLVGLGDVAAEVGDRRGDGGDDPGQRALVRVRMKEVSGIRQHSGRLTARPPVEVSLYFTLMSRPVWRMVSMQASSGTTWMPSPRSARRGGGDGLDGAEAVALDAGHLDEAADRVAGHAEVVLERDLGGVLDLGVASRRARRRGRRRPWRRRSRPRPGSRPRRRRSRRWS